MVIESLESKWVLFGKRVGKDFKILSLLFGVFLVCPNSTWAAKVDVGGFGLYVNCTGQGSPTVILEAGRGSYSPMWQLVQRKLEKDTRVCSYDRGGYGKSDKSTNPNRTASTLADELHALLHSNEMQAHSPGRFILVGTSFGGTISSVYASKYPEDLVGLILADASNYNYREDEAQSKLPEGLYDKVRNLRGNVPPSKGKLSFLQKRRIELDMLWNSSKNNLATDAEEAAEIPSLEQAQKLEKSSVPTIIIRRGKDSDEKFSIVKERAFPSLDDDEKKAISSYYEDGEKAWTDFQENVLPTKYEKSQVWVAEKSGHGIPVEQPEIIVEAVKSMLNRASSSDKGEIVIDLKD